MKMKWYVKNVRIGLMNYKIIIFKCGCRYIWLTGKDRPYQVCPIHKRPVGSYILWCIDCGLKIKAPPRVGYRQFRCVECRRKHENKVSAKWSADNPNGKKKKPTVHEQAEVKPPETQKEEAKRQLNAWYLKMRAIFGPVWENA